MKIAILGGTGNFGKGLALRLAKNNDVILGSRNVPKAKETARDYESICKVRYPNFSHIIDGEDNISAAKSSDMIFFCLKFEPALEYARLLKNLDQNKIVVSPIVDINNGRMFVSPQIDFLRTERVSQAYSRPSTSCAEALAEELDFRDRVVSALHTIPYEKLIELENPVNCDVLVCGDDILNAKVVCRVIEEIGVRALYAGPLNLSAYVEGIAISLISLSKHSKIKHPMIKIV